MHNIVIKIIYEWKGRKREGGRDRVREGERERVGEIKYVNCINRGTRRTRSFNLAAAIVKLVWSSNLNLWDKARFENEASFFLRHLFTAFSRCIFSLRVSSKKKRKKEFFVFLYYKSRFQTYSYYAFYATLTSISSKNKKKVSFFLYYNLLKIKNESLSFCYITNLDSKIIPIIQFTRLWLWLRVSNLLCLFPSIELIVDFPQRNRLSAKVLDDTFYHLGATRPLLNFV